jgi:hypothetical protein
MAAVDLRQIANSSTCSIPVSICNDQGHDRHSLSSLRIIHRTTVGLGDARVLNHVNRLNSQTPESKVTGQICPFD